MSKNLKLEKRAKEVIINQIQDIGANISIETVMALVRPHFLFNPNTAKEQAIRAKARELVSKVRDENGVRKCFIADDTVVNIEKTDDLYLSKKVRDRLQKQKSGIQKSLKKVKKKVIELGYQTVIDELFEEAK